MYFDDYHIGKLMWDSVLSLKPSPIMPIALTVLLPMNQWSLDSYICRRW